MFVALTTTALGFWFRPLASIDIVDLDIEALEFLEGGFRVASAGGGVS